MDAPENIKWPKSDTCLNTMCYLRVILVRVQRAKPSLIGAMGRSLQMEGFQETEGMGRENKKI